MDDKLAVLSRKLKEEAALLGGQIEPSSLERALREGRGEYIEEDGLLVAFGALWPRLSALEVGSIWVDTEYRGRKLSSRVFQALLGRQREGIPLFLITHEPHVVHLALKHDMQEADAQSWSTIIPWSASCGPCDRLPDLQKPACHFRGVREECRLFYKI